MGPEDETRVLEARQRVAVAKGKKQKAEAKLNQYRTKLQASGLTPARRKAVYDRIGKMAHQVDRHEMDIRLARDELHRLGTRIADG